MAVPLEALVERPILLHWPLLALELFFPQFCEIKIKTTMRGVQGALNIGYLGSIAF